jgi:carboxymethylenebutenolidase
MNKMIELKAADGHVLSAYEVAPKGKPRGGIAIIQEIFGVNAHIRSVADGYADDGYHVIAPGLFDRHERGYDRGYSAEEIDAGIKIARSMNPAHMLHDLEATIKKLSEYGKVAIVGYCLGGSLAFLAAAQLKGLACTVGYYGGMIAGNLDKKPKVPVMLHFGDQDQSIPAEAIDKIKAAVDPKMVQVFVYKGAGHAFNRHGNQAWHEPSAKLARERTLEFLRKHIG